MSDGVFIGVTPQRDRAFVEITLEPVYRPGDVQTVQHGPVPASALRIAISGELYEPRHRVAWAGGQIVEAIRTVQPGPWGSWTQADITSLCDIWERWHLNDMRAGCAHQGKPRMHSPNGYPQVDLASVAPCPVTGYTYGHAWLVELLPDDVLAEARRLAALGAVTA